MEDDLLQNVQKIDNNRKSCQRNTKDIEALKKQLASGDFKMPDNESEKEEEEDDDLGGEAVQKLQQLIARTEK